MLEDSILKSNFIGLSTPNHTHLKYIQKILLYKNIKTILLEKPGGSNFNDLTWSLFDLKIDYQR